LPATVILLSWPNEEELLRDNDANIACKSGGNFFTPRSIKPSIPAGRTVSHAGAAARANRDHWPTAFEEIQIVLKQEKILVADADPRAVFNEFAAVFLELFLVSPTLLRPFSPGLGDDIKRSRSCSIKTSTPTRSCRTRVSRGARSDRRHRSTASEAHEFFHALEASKPERPRARQYGAGGDPAPARRSRRSADQAPQTRKQAVTILAELLDRLKPLSNCPKMNASAGADCCRSCSTKPTKAAAPPKRLAHRIAKHLPRPRTRDVQARCRRVHPLRRPPDRSTSLAEQRLSASPAQRGSCPQPH